MTEKRRNLSVELRPRRLSEMIGLDGLVSELRNNMKDSVPLGIILAGESGAGKSTIAKILSIAVQCTHGEFGEPCEECLANELLFNIQERNCADLGKIENMRDLLPGLEYYPSFGEYRVIILDEAHGIGEKAQEVLLLPTEDKESKNLFILCTTDPSKIKHTIKRRCISYVVPGLSPSSVGTLVAKTISQAGGTQEAGPLVEAINGARITSPGVVVNAVERYLSGAAPEACVVVQDVSSINTWDLARACTVGNWIECQRILSSAVPADADPIKRSLSTHFRKKMLDGPKTPAQMQLLADAIHELSGNNASTVYESGFQLSILTASIWKICEMVQAAIAAKRAGGLPSFDGIQGNRPTVQ